MANLKEHVDNLNQMIMEGKILEAFDKYYADEVTMQENSNTPTEGKAACRKNEEDFVASITEFRGAKAKQSLVSDGLAVTEWEFDYDHKDWGTRNYTQLAVQKWKDGKIVSEHFVYHA